MCAMALFPALCSFFCPYSLLYFYSFQSTLLSPFKSPFGFPFLMGPFWILPIDVHETSSVQLPDLSSATFTYTFSFVELKVKGYKARLQQRIEGFGKLRFGCEREREGNQSSKMAEKGWAGQAVVSRQSLALGELLNYSPGQQPSQLDLCDMMWWYL